MEKHLKTFAWVISVLTIAGGIILGLICFFNRRIESYLGFLYISVGIFSGLLDYVLLMSFAESLETKKEILKTNNKIKNMIADYVHIPERFTGINNLNKKTSAEKSEEYWTCECGNTNDPQSQYCTACGHKK